MQERFIATADLGTSKIALSVAKITGENIQIIYYRETPSEGIHYSHIFNPRKVSAVLQSAIKAAEDDLGMKILQIVVGLPRYKVSEESASGKIERSNPGMCIEQEEIDNLKSIAQDDYPIEDKLRDTIYDAVAQSFSADELVGGDEQDIVGTTADVLEGNFKVFVGSKKYESYIDMAITPLGIACAQKCFVPHCIAEAVLTENEREGGVALVEVGAGVTSVTIYQNGILRHYGSIPFGAKSITTDIQHEFAFQESLAENIKLAFGACMPEKLQSMSDKIIQVNDEDNGTYVQLPVKYLSEVITSRAREIMDAVLYHIQESGYADRLHCGIVLTGGGANLTNLCGLIKEMSGYNVRMGFPRNRMFSADGCPGIGECSAVASVGMILAAKRNGTLNCMEEAPAKVEEVQVTEEPEEEQAGTVFDPEAFEKVKKEKKAPAAAPKPKKEPVIWKKFVNSVGDLFNNTLGDMYDEMNN